MAPGRRKGSGRAASAAAREQWKVGDLVLAKMKGFPAWPAMVSEPEKWGYSSDRKKLLVYFYGTEQIAFCNYADVEAFTEEKKRCLLTKRHGKGANFVRAVDEIVDIYEKLKRQNDGKFNSGDEGTVSSAGNSESSKSKSSNRSPELRSHMTNRHQSEALYVLTESRDVLNPDEIPATLMGDDLHDATTETNEPTGTISILDQLRQTPLATTTNSRKRRDAALQSFAIQRRVTSLRRFRSSSRGYQSTMVINDNNLAGGDLIPDSVQEESTLKEKSIRKVPHISFSCDVAMPVSAGLPFNGTSEDILSESASLKSELINLNDGSMLEFSCKVEHPGNGYSQVDRSNEDVRLNDKLDLPMKTVILKKKRKPNRKRVTSTTECAKLNQEATECAKLNQEAESQVQLGGSLSDSPNSRNESNERSHCVDGDEHLPLVKRARVRMSKQPVEGTGLDEIAGTKERSDTAVLIDKSDKYITPSSLGNTCLASRKETSSSPPVNDCTLTSGRDNMFWKAKTYQLKFFALDVEAALPPSKRLHRALEAMSANAAEATDDCTEAPRAMELIPNDCMDSLKTGPLLSTDGIVGSPAKPECLQPPGSDAFHTNASILSSRLTQNLEVPTITSSELKPDESLTGNFRRPSDNNFSGNLMDVKDCDGSSISKMADKDILDKNVQPCSFNFIVKQKNATSSEGIYDQLVSSDGISDQLSSALGVENMNQKLQPNKCLYSLVDNFGGDETLRSSIWKPGSVSNSKEREDFFPQNIVAPILSASISDSTASNTSGAIKPSNSQSNKNSRARDMQDVAKEVKVNATPKDWGISPDLTPMKDLIASAQAKRLLSLSTFSDNTVDGKTNNGVVSPSLLLKDESYGKGSPSNSTIYLTHALDDNTHYLQSGSRSPHAGSRQKGLDKFPCHEEANAARKTFEALLCTLSRTKESIARATRLAIDCAKYGIAGEVVEILLQNLERESSLYRRVDLLFLVDSITQCSRSQKGGAGDVYPSLVQSVLPRLLCAAAPPGNAAWENRRQCLKVLRVWLERKTIPVSIVRHHMRELESANEASFTSAYSRRAPRTERALNDPVREMEGMLVDEYGSNTSFQLPSFLHPRVFEDEEGSSDNEKSFEAVSPESNVEVDDGKGTTQVSTEKHRHVLEDVDGELEMEDLAPPCEVEVNSTCHVSGADTLGNTHYQLYHHHLVPIAPPLPEDKPPSPPPLPSSPLPMAPCCSTPPSLVPQHQSAGSHVLTDAVDFHLSSVTNNMQNQPLLSICQQPSNLDANLMSSVSVAYCTNGYAGPQKQLPPPIPSRSSSSYSNPAGPPPAMHTGNKNSVQPSVSVPLPNKTYCLQPPPPTISNQFSCVQAEPRQTQQSWGNCSLLPDRFQYVHDTQRERFYGDRGTRGPIQHEIPESMFSPSVHLGSVLPGKGGASATCVSLYGPPSEPSTIPCSGWSLPPRTSSYSVPPSRPSLKYPISRVAGVPGYWRSG